MKLYSVNELIKNKEKLNGKRVYVEGLLEFVIGYYTYHVAINQWPKAEHIGNSISISEGGGAYQYNKHSLTKLSDTKVVCLGEFHTNCYADKFFYRIVATELVYYKKWHEANGQIS